MAESYEVLAGKYRTAIVSIHELEQERDLYEQQADELRQDYKRMEKNVKDLCESILKKEREKKNEKKWMNMPTMEMIQTAQTSLEHYFPSMEEQIKKVLQQNEDRRKEITELRKQIDRLKQENEQNLQDLEKTKDAAIDALTEKLKTGRMEEEDIDQTIQTAESKVQKAVKKKKKSMHDRLDEIGDSESETVSDDQESDHSTGKTDYTITVESKDGTADLVASSVASVIQHGGYKDISGSKIFDDKKTQKETQKAIKKAVNKLQNDDNAEILQEVKDLTDTNKIYLRILGESGCSDFNAILNYGMEHFPDKASRSALYSSNGQLKRKNFVEQTNVAVPGIPKLGLYKLTDKGKAAYQYLFSKEPVEPEMDVIIRNHTSLEHGYGIMQVADLIQTMPFIAKTHADVVYITRIKEYIVKTSDTTSYIPDIVIVTQKSGKEMRTYIEYETGKCNDTDFFAKCYKIASFSRYINIVVPDATAKGIVLERAQKWKKNVLDKKELTDRNITINISSYADLKAGVDNQECNAGINWKHGEIVTVMSKKKES